MIDDQTLSTFTHIYELLRNPLRLRIVALCTDRSYIVAELSRMLPLSYPNTNKYVAMLARAGLVKKSRNSDGTVSVRSLVRLKERGAFEYIDR